MNQLKPQENNDNPEVTGKGIRAEMEMDLLTVSTKSDIDGVLVQTPKREQKARHDSACLQFQLRPAWTTSAVQG